MNWAAAHAEGIQELIDEMGDDCPQIGWRNEMWNVIPGSVFLKKALAKGGFSPDVMPDLRITALCSTFGEDAKSLKDLMLETRMTYLGDDYKICAVAILIGGLQVEIHANSYNQGA